MSDEEAITARGGNGLLMAGTVIALLVAAGVYLSLNSEEAVEEVMEEKGVSGASSSDGEVLAATPSETQEIADQPAMVDELNTSQDENKATSGDTRAKAPSIDEVRVESGGTVVVAGRADPGRRVYVLLDGDVVTSAEADASGAFAAIGSIDENATASSLTLRTGEGAQAIASVEEVILAPMPQKASASSEPMVPETGNTATEDEVKSGASDQHATEDAIVSETEEAVSERPLADANDAESDIASLEIKVPDQDISSGAAPIESVRDEPLQDAIAATTSANDLSEEKKSDEEDQTSAEIAVLRSDATGVSLQQTTPTNRVVLDTIGYSDEGVVQLGGRAGNEAVVVRAYLNNRAVVLLPVDANGNWRGLVPDVDAGVYTLRIDAVSSDGRVTSRVETPFQREAPATLAAAAGNTGGVVRAITVQAGDTLWAIARERYGEGLFYVQVFDANRDAIRDPDLIYPGQVFDLPSD